MNQQRSVLLARFLFIACVGSGLLQCLIWEVHLTAPPTLNDAMQKWLWSFLFPLVFSGLGALIIARAPGNQVGWLLMISALGGVNPASTILENLPAPTHLTPGLFLLVWLEGWSWIPVIFPIFLVPLYFPTGRPPFPRWNWVSWLAVGMWLFFILVMLFIEPIAPLNEAWSFPNPIGFIPAEMVNGLPMIIWGIGLVTVVASSVVSLYVRFRRAQEVERQQIKWLLYTGALFAAVYALAVFSTNESGFNESAFNVLSNLLFVASILAMPVAIAVAILRYRLYDIDVIIRRTLQYTLLTGMLALVYFGSVLLLQSLVQTLTGQSHSPIVIVISTLGLAALFNPLRKRIQDVIDRRFYRKKYDSELALVQFAVTARDEVDLEQLVGVLLSVVERTMQPERASLWIIRRSGTYSHRLNDRQEVGWQDA
jgi:MFS family permease